MGTVQGDVNECTQFKQKHLCRSLLFSYKILVTRYLSIGQDYHKFHCFDSLGIKLCLGLYDLIGPKHIGVGPAAKAKQKKSVRSTIDTERFGRSMHFSYHAQLHNLYERLMNSLLHFVGYHFIKFKV
jgi:hypothetical protein